MARALANGAKDLYEIDLDSGSTSWLSAIPEPLDDIALHRDGRLFGASPDTLWLVELEAGRMSPVASVPGRFNALDFSPTGELYGAVDDRVVRIDIDRGRVSTVARFPAGLRSGGDIAFLNRELFAAVTRFPLEPNDSLMRVDVMSGTTSMIGSIDQPCVWGLATSGDTLFGITCTGLVVVVNLESGHGDVISSDGIEFHGAAAR